LIEKLNEEVFQKRLFEIDEYFIADQNGEDLLQVIDVFAHDSRVDDNIVYERLDEE
jgi:hypothetical protein